MSEKTQITINQIANRFQFFKIQIIKISSQNKI